MAASDEHPTDDWAFFGVGHPFLVVHAEQRGLLAVAGTYAHTRATSVAVYNSRSFVPRAFIRSRFPVHALAAHPRRPLRPACVFAGTDVFVVTMDWSNTPAGPAGYPTPRQILHPNGIRWWTEPDKDDPDPAFHTHTRLYADRHRWNRGCLDGLLRAVADEAVVEVFVADTELQRIYHPYDGGADVILATPAERDRVRDQHTDWLSSHPAGL
ncbi:hypothetical protein ABZ464_28775 [Streptomyces sp. NPDC005820]|uniref:DUF3885 domain-containing protein n=1 Tax=Streptomyces sp. NPDC005820 TaxID=3157069 RepID=UPI00340732B1